MHPPSLTGVAVRAAAIILAALALAWTTLLGNAWARDTGQWGEVPDHIRSWFKSVRSPHGVPCCDIADGHRTTLGQASRQR